MHSKSILNRIHDCNASVAQLDRASPSGGEGRRFEPSRVYHSKVPAKQVPISVDQTIIPTHQMTSKLFQLVSGIVKFAHNSIKIIESIPKWGSPSVDKSIHLLIYMG